MNEMIDALFDWLLEGVPAPVAVLIVAILPIVEARLAIPLGLKCGLSPLMSGVLGWLGSSLVSPVLLVLFLPLVDWISRRKAFKRAGEAVLDRFNKKAQKLGGGARAYLGLFVFAALPLPLTGVWTASAVAAILGLNYTKSLISIVSGNLIASILLTLLSVFFKTHINTIILAITAAALLAVTTLIIKTLPPKKQKE